MKVILEATEDIRRTVGNVTVSAKKGDRQEFSSYEAEIALSTGAFGFVDSIPETSAEESSETETGKTLDEQRAELMKLGKGELVKRADELEGFSPAMNKTELVELILMPRAPQLLPETEQGADSSEINTEGE
ncbi:MAG: hypothetical protein LUM44_17615 [Pyrinomonadaceae bacterium]|nr:hypothetical protein [Pyrinomonadaceae bacterium]